MANTRFNPSPTGILHLGHMYTMLVNEYIAYSTGGKFYVRFEDTSEMIKRLDPIKTRKIVESQKYDIEWLGLKVDGWSMQSDWLPEAEDILHKHPEFVIYHDYKPEYVVPLIVCKGTDWLAIPYVPYQTAERVVIDHLMGITHIIRGDDFVTEYSLYCYFCQKFGYAIPEFVFLPRLAGLKGDISKTHGGYKIADFRNEGYTPEELKHLIIKACLIYPLNGFELYNLQSNPRLSI